jgi:nitrite reductase/ring-hydroxylating ferredoxin subunit
VAGITDWADEVDLTSGAVVNGPATEPLGVYEVREVDGEIQARV